MTVRKVMYPHYPNRKKRKTKKLFIDDSNDWIRSPACCCLWPVQIVSHKHLPPPCRIATQFVPHGGKICSDNLDEARAQPVKFMALDVCCCVLDGCLPVRACLSKWGIPWDWNCLVPTLHLHNISTEWHHSNTRTMRNITTKFDPEKSKWWE